MFSSSFRLNIYFLIYLRYISQIIMSPYLLHNGYYLASVVPPHIHTKKKLHSVFRERGGWCDTQLSAYLQRLFERRHQVALHVHVDLAGHLRNKKLNILKCILLEKEKNSSTLTASRRRRSCSSLRSSARFAADRSSAWGVVGVPGEGLPCGDALMSSTTRAGMGSITILLLLLLWGEEKGVC